MIDNDTIVAQSTPTGTGGVALIRISGSLAIEIVNKIFSKDIESVQTHTAHYGKIFDSNGKIIDCVLVTVMKAPGSYTGENVVEIGCHGSMTVVYEIILSCCNAGARYALAGEFTKRAFLNGKMDLSQAEAVIDIINSTNQGALQSGVNQLEGNLSAKINAVRDNLIHIMAWISAEADFPEEGISGISDEGLRIKIQDSLSALDKLLDSAKNGKLIKDGIATTIIGRPNAGKSSVLNAMLDRKRAIVTDIPGTTRDTIEEFLQIDGITLLLIDTAGIRETDDTVEKIGVDIAVDSAKKADLILYVVDLSVNPADEDTNIINMCKDKKTIMVLNKTDLSTTIYKENYENLLPNAIKVYTQASEGIGIDSLKEAIMQLFKIGDITQKDNVMLTNIRHIEAVSNAKKQIETAYNAYVQGTPVDFMAIDIQGAIESLGEITGMTVSEEIVDRIFKEFCVGK